MDRAGLPARQCTVYALVDLLIQGRIWLNPPYQRQLVWGPRERQLLIDSIVKDFDIGKFFFREVTGKPYNYEVIDGQQRLDTLKKFKLGEISFPPESGSLLVGKTLPNLDAKAQIELGSYVLDVVVVRNADDHQVREMFRRLQLGKPLTTGERLKASYGALHDFVEGRILQHRLFDGLLGFRNKRDVFFEVSSQIVMLGFQGGACDVDYKSLEQMYYQNQSAVDDAKARELLRDLDFYQAVLGEDGATFHPDKANFVSIFLFVSKLRRNYVVNAEIVIRFIKSLESERRAMSLADTELQQYNKKLSGGTAKRRSIQFRFETLMKRFLNSNPNTRLLDDRRVLMAEQRLAVYWRDTGKCRACNNPVSDRSFHVHHTDAWHGGGPTTVANSLTVCTACHQKITAGLMKL